MLGGVSFDGEPPLDGNSDADVVLHALTNAISGITGVPVLGAAADRLCAAGVTDSRAYVKEALQSLAGTIQHVSFSLEAKRPKLLNRLPDMQQSIASILNVDAAAVALTVTSGEGLTACGRGEGIACFCILTAAG